MAIVGQGKNLARLNFLTWKCSDVDDVEKMAIWLWKGVSSIKHKMIVLNWEIKRDIAKKTCRRKGFYQTNNLSKPNYALGLILECVGYVVESCCFLHNYLSKKAIYVWR